MAFCRIEHCDICGADTQHTNGRCDTCMETSEKERIWDWNAQPIEQKLDDIRKRIEKLERGPTRF